MSEPHDQHLMIDLETLGTEPDSVILSIAGVAFEPRGGLGREFEMGVDRQSCERLGLSVDPETLGWWEQQPEAARECLTGGFPLSEVLDQFEIFYRMVDPDNIWACSPAFDCVILEHASGVCNHELPWNYWEQRDVRTLRHLPQWESADLNGVEHRALDDAREQALSVAMTLRKLDEAKVIVDE